MLQTTAATVCRRAQRQKLNLPPGDVPAADSSCTRCDRERWMPKVSRTAEAFRGCRRCVSSGCTPINPAMVTAFYGLQLPLSPMHRPARLIVGEQRRAADSTGLSHLILAADDQPGHHARRGGQPVIDAVRSSRRTSMKSIQTATEVYSATAKTDTDDGQEGVHAGRRPMRDQHPTFVRLVRRSIFRMDRWFTSSASCASDSLTRDGLNNARPSWQVVDVHVDGVTFRPQLKL
jgi:hypothetical protein